MIRVYGCVKLRGNAIAKHILFQKKKICTHKNMQFENLQGNKNLAIKLGSHWVNVG